VKDAEGPAFPLFETEQQVASIGIIRIAKKWTWGV
jgi:hypothetical protein